MSPQVLLALLVLHATAEVAINSNPDKAIITIPLTKQLVPVKRNNVVVSHKSAYFGRVQLGAPRSQEFSVVFDTGSGHVIIPSAVCESPACLVHRRYDTKKSSTAVDIDVDGTRVEDGSPRDQVTVGFGTGEVTGEFASETVCLGVDGMNGSGGKARCADNMRVVMAVEMSEEPFGSFAFDGVVGLGLSSLALDPQFSFFGMLAAQDRIAKPHIGMFLADNDEDISEISFGGHNPRRLKSPLEWAPVAHPELGYWQIRLLGISVGGKHLDYCSAGDCSAIVDTGTSHFGVPTGLISDLQESLSSRHPGTDPVDCRDANGPEVQIQLEGFNITLGTKDYARRLPFLSSGSSVPGVGAPGGRVCRPRLMRVGLPAPLGPKLFILGEPVLRRYYTVFNWGEKKVGFGLANQDSERDDVLMMMQVTSLVRRSNRRNKPKAMRVTFMLLPAQL